MAIQVVNKSRQAIPVDIIEKGVGRQVLLLSNGPESIATSEGETITIANLAERGLVVVREIVEAVEARPVVEDKKASSKK